MSRIEAVGAGNDCVRINGKEYLAVDAVFGAIDQVRDEVVTKKRQTLSPEWNCYVTADAYLCNVANKVEALRRGECVRR